MNTPTRNSALLNFTQDFDADRFMEHRAEIANKFNDQVIPYFKNFCIGNEVDQFDLMYMLAVYTGHYIEGMSKGKKSTIDSGLKFFQLTMRDTAYDAAGIDHE